MDKTALKESVLDEEEHAVMDDLEQVFYRPTTPEEEKERSDGEYYFYRDFFSHRLSRSLSVWLLSLSKYRNDRGDCRL